LISSDVVQDVALLRVERPAGEKPYLKALDEVHVCHMSTLLSIIMLTHAGFRDWQCRDRCSVQRLGGEASESRCKTVEPRLRASVARRGRNDSRVQGLQRTIWHRRKYAAGPKVDPDFCYLRIDVSSITQDHPRKDGFREVGVP
jgi:hypothetical protein